jgi:hypothetical protein
MEDPLSVFLDSAAVRAIKPEEAMSPDEWVTHAVALANEPLLTRPLISRLLLGGGRESVDGEIVGTLSDAFRKQFTEWLDLIISNPAQARRKLASAVNGVLRDVVFLPFAGSHGVRYRIVSRTPGTALHYAVLLLLLNDELGFGARLARCRLESCRRFFLKERSKRRYCSPGHMKLADSSASAERVAAMRAGITVAAWRRRRKPK